MVSYKLSNMPVRAVSEIWDDDLRTPNYEFSSDRLSCSQSPSCKVLLRPDQATVIDLLNRFGQLEPQDYLLPTGEPGIKYISLRALSDTLRSEPATSNTTDRVASTYAVGSGPVLSVQMGVAVSMEESEREKFKTSLKMAEDLVLAIYSPEGPAEEELRTFTKAIARMTFGSPDNAAKTATNFITNDTQLNPWQAGKVFALSRSVMTKTPEVAGKYGYAYLEEKGRAISQELRHARAVLQRISHSRGLLIRRPSRYVGSLEYTKKRGATAG